MVCSNTLKSRNSAQARGDKLRGTGAGKAYRKLNGRHEHRVIAERKIGRLLLPGEVVHHIDDNKLNNHPDNLEVLASQAEHARLHATKNRTCSLCDRKHYAVGYCSLHYQRLHKGN